MSRVVWHLPDERPPGPVAEVVELLRDALRRAEAGEITGVAISMACRVGTDAQAVTTGKNGIATIHLATSRMQRQLVEYGGSE